MQWRSSLTMQAGRAIQIDGKKAIILPVWLDVAPPGSTDDGGLWLKYLLLLQECQGKSERMKVSHDRNIGRQKNGRTCFAPKSFCRSPRPE